MKKALVGYGGHAREVMAQMGVKLTCFVDDEYVVEGTLPLSKFNPKKYALMVAVADSKDRFDIVQRLPKETKYFTWIHPTALIMSDDVEIGEGSFIGAHSILTTNIKIGKHALLNRGNHIGHDCEIGDYFSAMPGAIVSGNVKIYDCVYMGSNSSIREKLSIHSLCTIGMNAAVVKHIEDSGMYVGVPTQKNMTTIKDSFNHLREMTLDDLDILRINKNKNKDYFFLKDEITKEMQLKWFEFMKTQSDNFMFICVNSNNEPFGCIGYRKLDNVIDVYNVMRFTESDITMSKCMKDLFSIIENNYGDILIQVVVLSNNPAIKWYEKNGFRVMEHKDNFVKMVLKK